MSAKYGLPYKGNKSRIAEWVIANLPRADTLVDLFCGGCAVTHAALLSGKWNHIIANDIHGDVPQLFVDAASGKYADEKRWISREDFFRLKDTDAYVRLCWSFGNDGMTYMYGKAIEPWKRALHMARVCGDNSLLLEMGIDSDGSKEDILAHFDEYVEILKLNQSIRSVVCLENQERATVVKNLVQLQSLQSTTRLQSLQSLQSLQISGKDYRDVPLLSGSIVYCDVPYSCTKNNYGVAFDRHVFFDWACAQPVPVIISEYNIEDDRFAELASTQKVQLSGGANAQKFVTERLYCPREQLETIQEMLRKDKTDE